MATRSFARWPTDGNTMWPGQEVFINNRDYTIRLLWHRVLSRLNQLMILFDSISSRNRIPEELEM